MSTLDLITNNTSLLTGSQENGDLDDEEEKSFTLSPIGGKYLSEQLVQYDPIQVKNQIILQSEQLAGFVKIIFHDTLSRQGFQKRENVPPWKLESPHYCPLLFVLDQQIHNKEQEVQTLNHDFVTRTKNLEIILDKNENLQKNVKELLSHKIQQSELQKETYFEQHSMNHLKEKLDLLQRENRLVTKDYNSINNEYQTAREKMEESRGTYATLYNKSNRIQQLLEKSRDKIRTCRSMQKQLKHQISVFSAKCFDTQRVIREIKNKLAHHNLSNDLMLYKGIRDKTMVIDGLRSQFTINGIELESIDSEKVIMDRTSDDMTGRIEVYQKNEFDVLQKIKNTLSEFDMLTGVFGEEKKKEMSIRKDVLRVKSEIERTQKEQRRKKKEFIKDFHVKHKEKVAKMNNYLETRCTEREILNSKCERLKRDIAQIEMEEKMILKNMDFYSSRPNNDGQSAPSEGIEEIGYQKIVQKLINRANEIQKEKEESRRNCENCEERVKKLGDMYKERMERLEMKFAELCELDKLKRDAVFEIQNKSELKAKEEDTGVERITRNEKRLLEIEKNHRARLNEISHDVKIRKLSDLVISTESEISERSMIRENMKITLRDLQEEISKTSANTLMNLRRKRGDLKDEIANLRKRNDEKSFRITHLIDAGEKVKKEKEKSETIKEKYNGKINVFVKKSDDGQHHVDMLSKKNERHMQENQQLEMKLKELDLEMQFLAKRRRLNPSPKKEPKIYYDENEFLSLEKLQGASDLALAKLRRRGRKRRKRKTKELH